MSRAFEPVLHALQAEPRTARPGEIVRLLFRTRNAACEASPRLRVHFALPPGLEAIDCDAVELEPVAAGAHVEAGIDARVAHPMDDGTELEIQALLETPDGRHGTNVCRVVVRSRPVLDGAASGVYVEAVDADTVRVRAVVANEGDGPAHDVRIVLPPPLGTVAFDETADAPGATTNGIDVARIDVGESVIAALYARIVVPSGVVCADGAYAEFRDATRRTIPCRAEVIPQAIVVLRDVTAVSGRRNLEVTVHVRNDGWADARDVRVRAELPPPLRLVDGSVAVDGVPVPRRAARRKAGSVPFARVEKAPGSVAIVVERLAAQTEMQLTFAATVTSAHAAAGGDVAVTLGNDDGVTVLAPFAIEPVRDVRARIIAAPRCAEPGGIAALLVELRNLGDAAERVAVAAAGTCAPATAFDTAYVDLDPGHVDVATAVVRVPSDAAQQRTLPVELVVFDADGERTRLAHELVVRHADSSASARAASCDAAGERPRYGVRGTLHVPDEVVRGAAFRVTALIDVDDSYETLAIRAVPRADAAYVRSSTLLDGCVVIDPADGAPLEGEGLVLRDIAAGTRVTVAWSMVPPRTPAAAGTLELSLELCAGGTVYGVAPVSVTVHDGPSFPLRPLALPYHVDALLAVPSPAEPTACGAAPAEFEQDVEPDAIAVPARTEARRFTGEWTLRLTEVRAEAIARDMRRAADGRLISHLIVLRALSPEYDGGDVAVGDALRELSDAARELFDRVSVKLRIPGVDVGSADLDHARLRDAIAAVFACVDPDSEQVPAPHDALAMMRALAALVPSRCDDDPPFAAALRCYAGVLEDTLARWCDAPRGAFDDALGRDAGFALADARTDVLTALHARPALAGAA